MRVEEDDIKSIMFAFLRNRKNCGLFLSVLVNQN